MTLSAWSLRNNGNLLSNSVNNFDETKLYDGSLVFDGKTYYQPSSTIPSVSGNFTIETWVYPLSYSDMMVGSSTIDSNLQIFRINETGRRGAVSVYNNGAYIFQYVGNSVVPGQWSHLAWSRSGTTNTLYINGISAATSINNNTAFNFNLLGAFAFNGAIGYVPYWYIGYLKDFRLTTSTVYTTNFTPPTSLLTKLTNTTFLLNVSNYYNRFYDSASNSVQIKNPLVGSNPPGFSSQTPYPQSRPTTQFRVTQNEIVYSELDEVTLTGGSTQFRLTNSGTAQISGIFDEVSGIPTTSTTYLATATNKTTSYIHTVPSNINVMIIEVWGGGGGMSGIYFDTGGNTPSYLATTGGAPGSGGYARSIIYNASTLTGKTISVTVGGGGSGAGNGTNAPGNKGSTSTVSTSSFATITAQGGAGSLGTANYGSPGGTAAGGNDANITGNGSTTTVYAFSFNTSFTPINPNWVTWTTGIVGYFGKVYGSGGSIDTVNGTTIGDNGQSGAVVFSYY